MATETTSLNELKEKRLNFLIALGEETHGEVRKQNNSLTDKMKKLSLEIQKIDVQIDGLTNQVSIGCCPQCQTPLDTECIFCKQCGFAVKEYFSAYVKKCSFCGNPMKENQKFCIRCGEQYRKQVKLEK